MKEIIMHIPDEMVSLLEVSNKDDEYERNAFLLYPYIHNRTISIEDAAKMLNVDYITMCMFYFNHGFNLEIGKMGSITVFIKIKDDSYMPTIDKAFVELTRMKKIKEGVYHSDDDVFTVCSNTVEALMEKEWFRDIVMLLVLKVGNEVEDLLENFNDK